MRSTLVILCLAVATSTYAQGSFLDDAARWAGALFKSGAPRATVVQQLETRAAGAIVLYDAYGRALILQTTDETATLVQFGQYIVKFRTRLAVGAGFAAGTGFTVTNIDWEKCEATLESTKVIRASKTFNPCLLYNRFTEIPAAVDAAAR